MEIRHTTNVSTEFNRDGYAVVPNVLPIADVDAIRDRLDKYFGADDATVEMHATEFLGQELLWQPVLQDKVVSAVKSILGDSYTLFPNMTVRKSLYVGWHVDSAFTGEGKSYVWEREFKHVQGAIYLQDNTADFGGGLDLVKGSHKAVIAGMRGDNPLNRTLNTAANRIFRKRSRLEAKAGDLVLWHARTEHRSTPPYRPEGGPRKYGIFFSAGSTNPYYAHRYLTHLIGQTWQRRGGEPTLFPRYRDIVDVRYPDGFPQRFRRRVEDAHINVASF